MRINTGCTVVQIDTWSIPIPAHAGPAGTAQARGAEPFGGGGVFLLRLPIYGGGTMALDVKTMTPPVFNKGIIIINYKQPELIQAVR